MYKKGLRGHIYWEQRYVRVTVKNNLSFMVSHNTAQVYFPFRWRVEPPLNLVATPARLSASKGTFTRKPRMEETVLLWLLLSEINIK